MDEGRVRTDSDRINDIYEILSWQASRIRYIEDQIDDVQDRIDALQRHYEKITGVEYPLEEEEPCNPIELFEEMLQYILDEIGNLKGDIDTGVFCYEIEKRKLDTLIHRLVDEKVLDDFKVIYRNI